MKTLLTQLSLLALMSAGCALSAQDQANLKAPAASVDEQAPPVPPASDGDPQSDQTQTPATSAPPVAPYDAGRPYAQARYRPCKNHSSCGMGPRGSVTIC